MNLSMRQKQNQGYREQTGSCQGGGKRGLDWEFWINRCKLVYIEWINNKVLQYSSLLLLLSHVRLCATP